MVVHDPTSTLISSLSLNYHLCADDTQLFLSFYSSNLTPAPFTSRMLCKLYPPMDTLQKLNFSSFDTGLKQQLAKLTPAHLIQTLLVILASFLMNILHFLIRYLLFLNPATYIFVNFAASVHVLISKQPAPLLSPLFTLSLTTATHLV